MFPLTPIVLGGTIIVSVLGLKKTYKSHWHPLIKNNNKPQIQEKSSLKCQSLNALLAVEAAYQAKIQKYIDPLFGQTRHQHLQELTSTKSRKMSKQERLANLQLGFGSIAIISVLISRFIYAPFIGVTILLGMTDLSAFYYNAYLEWQRTRKFGSIHLGCIYDAFMWLGGFAVVGAFRIALFGIGLKVKTITEARAHKRLSETFQLQPDTVWVRINDTEVEIAFEQLAIGDTLVLHSGQVVPIDGTVITGSAIIDQHVLTGEAQPAEVTVADPVYASTLVISGSIDVQVEKTGSETTAGRLGAIVKQTAKYNASTTLKVVEIGDRYTGPTLALSALSFPFIGPASAICIMGANFTFDTYTTGPVAVLNFLNTASKNGILIKDFKALENFQDVDLVIFDKTGTLTVEQPTVGRIHQYGDYSEAQVLAFAAAAEARQNHPIANAILAAAEAAELVIPAIEDTYYALGLGLKVKLVAEHKILRVGSTRFLGQENIELPTQFAYLSETCYAEGHSLVMVALDNTCIGGIELHPSIRPETPRIIQQLKKQDLDLCIISGDQTAPTQRLAEKLGIDRYFANVLPEGKAELVERFQQEGRHICFIGDGINDAIAMHKAEVSISLRGASTAATDAAQIILMDGSLNKLLQLFGLAQAFEHRLLQNLYITAGVSGLAISGIFLAGFSFAAIESLSFIALISAFMSAMRPVQQHLTKKHDVE
ncbi:MAG: heavy metal translocating P-type ATPase [Pseudomonadota bacterium]